VVNSLAYYDTAKVTAVESFIVQAPRVGAKKIDNRTIKSVLIQRLTLNDLTIEQHILNLSLIIEGAGEKASQCIILLKSLQHQNTCFNELKYIFLYQRKFKTVNNLNGPTKYSLKID